MRNLFRLGAPCTTRFFSQLQPRLNLPSQTKAAQSKVVRNTTQWLDHVYIRAMEMMTVFKDVSGYADIEKLKQKIAEQRENCEKLNLAANEARKQQSIAVAERISSQREVSELLTRKHEWSPKDIERFTLLYKDDHHREVAVESTQKESKQAEDALESARANLMQLIGERYHEEQIWSDRIRQASTWGTWIILGINFTLFLVVQLGLEPWKRRRMVRAVTEAVRNTERETVTPETLTETDLAETQTDSLAETQTDSLAETQTDSLAETQRDSLAETQRDSLAETQTDTNVPERTRFVWIQNHHQKLLDFLQRWPTIAKIYNETVSQATRFWLYLYTPTSIEPFHVGLISLSCGLVGYAMR